MIELATRTFVDAGMNRPVAIGAVCGLGFLLGVPSALSENILANQDFVWGIGLLISGGFVATAVLRYGVRRFRLDAIAGAPGDVDPGRGWEVLIGIAIPAQAVVLLGWWLYQSATTIAPDTWFNPLEPFSVMTCLVQWALALVVFIALNNWMQRRTLAASSAASASPTPASSEPAP
jgi:NSS family neurotransmitter:Na+ symporter